MSVKGYATLLDVELVLGATLAAERVEYATLLLESAEAWIDRYTGRIYAMATVTDELHLVEGGFVRLDSRPVTAITSVSARRYPFIAETPTVLVNLEGYELLDAADGRLYVGRGYESYLLTVSYTASAVVPAGVRAACAALVAHWLRPTIDGITGDVSSYSIPGEISVTYAGTGGQSARSTIPATVLDLLGRRAVFV